MTAMRLTIVACVMVVAGAAGTDEALSLVQTRAVLKTSKPENGTGATDPQAHANLMVTSSASIASTFAVNEKGYQSVAALKSPPVMTEFIRRLAASRDLLISDEGGLRGFVQYYDGVRSSQGFFTMANELDSIARFQPSGWLKLGAGAAAPLNEDGYDRLVTGGSGTQMIAFVRRVARAHGLYVTNDGGLEGFARFYSGENGQQRKWSLRHMVKEMDEISLMAEGGWLRKGRTATSGLSVSLDQAGYKQLLDSGATNTPDMAIFIRRIVESRGRRVVNDASLKGFAKFYSGEVRKWSYDHLAKELDDVALLADGWVKEGAEDTTALTASLDQEGYKALLQKHSTPAMAVFVRRVAESRGHAVASEGGLYGFARFYSGESGSWGYDHLVQELDGIAKLPTAWLKPLGLE